MDGYRIAAPGHIAALKGVIADEVRFERGLTRATMSVQARCERIHVHRAAGVVTSSRYSAKRACELYGLEREPLVVPELIDLAPWHERLAQLPRRRAARFTVLYVGRFYRRKRVEFLLAPPPECGPQSRISKFALSATDPAPPLASPGARAAAERTVTWLGDISRAHWPPSTTAPTSSACPACRKASASCCWKRWRRASRSSRARRGGSRGGPLRAPGGAG